MTYKHRFHTSPRMFDLDTQRHVTSRTYEAFAWEGRMRTMGELGYSLESMLESQQSLDTVLTHCSFSKEQMPGADLEVITYLQCGDGRQYWYQEILQSDGAVACKIATETQLKDPQDICAFSLSAGALQGTESGINPQTVIEQLPHDFPSRKKASAVETEVVAQYSERTPFFDYPPASFWRFIEEGRWGFSHEIGLDQKRILEMDTVTFFTSGTFRIYRQPRAGEVLKVHTWVDRIEKIRCFLRSDVVDADGELLMSNIEEQLIVSLSRRRPRRAGPEYVHMVEKYLENTPSD